MNVKEDVNISELYRKECTLPKNDFIKLYNVNENGLSYDEAFIKNTKFRLK